MHSHGFAPRGSPSAVRSSSLPPSPHTGTSLSGPFVFDDTASIVENPTIRHLWPIGPVLTPPYVAAETVGGRPVLNLSFAINYLFGGASPLGYHALWSTPWQG